MRKNPTHNTGTAAQTAPNWNFHQGDRSPHRSNTLHAGKGLLIIQILYWLSVCAGLWFSYLNVFPYSEATKFVLNSVSDNVLYRVLLSLPMVGAALNFVSLTAHWLIGTILWGTIQLCELLPIILRRDRAFLRMVIADSEAHQQFSIRPNDDPFTKRLKGLYNRLPVSVISNSRYWALGAYTVDFLICVSVYPPTQGGFGDLMFVLMTGQWLLLDWKNLVMIGVSLFAVEAIVMFLLWLGAIGWYYKRSRE